MDGEISFQDSINERLNSIKIKKDHIKILNRKLKNYITPTFQNNIEWLKTHSINIYIFSGGFKEIIIPIADKFNIPTDHIFANDFIYNEDGIVIGIDKKNPLSRSGGKVEKAKELNLDGKIFMVGDGSTDAEVKDLGDKVSFLAFVENTYRNKVVEKSDYTAHTFENVIEFIQSSQ